MNYKELWKNLARNKANTKEHTIQYCILRAIFAKSENKLEIAKHFLHKAFSPITNQNKLANGATPYQALNGGYWGHKDIEHRTLILGQRADEFMSEDDILMYNYIQRNVLDRPDIKLMRHYSYFITRQDISPEYQLVQTAHAALELGNKLQPEQVKNLYFTCCGVDDLFDLEDIERLLKNRQLNYVTFREPDIGNQKTAIGVYPIPEHQRGTLRALPLLRFNQVPSEQSI